MTTSNYHAPVMLQECIDALAIKPNGRYVDVTFGGGGHSSEILKALGSKGTLIAFDQDADAAANQIQDERFVFIDQNFEFINNHLSYQGLIPVNGVLADLGVSSHQFDVADRGFSYRFDDAVLDMRMNQQNGFSAADVLNSYPESKLSDVFYQYGELRNAHALANAVNVYRSNQRIETVAHLKEALKRHTPRMGDYKFFAPVFQALRIEVNREMDVLKQFLLQMPDVIDVDGRLVVMSYHSLEDRLVKNFMYTGSFSGEPTKDFYGNLIRPFEPVQRKVMTASAEEIEANPRARSVKFRVAKRVGGK